MSGQTQTRRPTPADIKREVREAVQEVLAEERKPQSMLPEIPMPTTEEGKAAYRIAVLKTKTSIWALLKELHDNVHEAEDFPSLDKAFAALEPRMEQMSRELEETLGELAKELAPTP